MINKIKELYSYRELLFNLVKKELKVKYRNSVLGFFWSLLSPLLMMLVFTFIFSHIFRFDIKNFPVFLLVGILPWNFHVLSLSSSVSAVLANGNLVKKVYFPREILPISIVLANFVNFLLEFLVLFGFLIVFRFPFYIYFYLLILIILIQLIFSLGLAFIFSCLNVYFRDIQHFVSILLLVWFYASPIIYPADKVIPAKYQLIYNLNPLASLITLYRQVLYYVQFPSLKMLIYALAGSIALFVFGYLLFNRYAPEFAEEV